MMRKRFRAGSGAVLKARTVVIPFMLFSIACSAGRVCKELASCGGNPVGKWAQVPLGDETPGTYCQEMIHRPPVEAHLQNQLLPVTRQRLPEKANADWCSDLVVTRDSEEAVKRHLYWWENLPYVFGFLEYGEDGKFRVDFSQRGFVERWYSATCLRKYGYTGNCKTFEADLTKANQGAVEYSKFNCSDNVDKGGCNCSFELFSVHNLFGVYSQEGSTMTHFPSSPTAHFSQASVCVQGDVLQISGLQNSYLWDRPGLRSIEMVRVDCADGRIGPGELGIDCGLACSNPCPAN